MKVEMCNECFLYRELNKYGRCSKCEDVIKSKSEIMDFDTHIKILNFLIHIQSMGVIDEKQRCFYSACIQDYLKQRKSNIEFLENVLNEIK